MRGMLERGGGWRDGIDLELFVHKFGMKVGPHCHDGGLIWVGIGLGLDTEAGNA